MISRLFFIIFLINLSSLFAQLDVTSFNSDDLLDDLEEFMLSDVLGCNLQISNLEYTGSPDAIGTFIYNPNNNICSGDFGLDRGLLMTNGMIDYAVGPNNNGDDGEEWNIEYEDTFFHNYLVDQEVITPSVDLFDPCVIEFDLISSDSVSLDFEVIFGSEEYTEWMSPFYADAFAFFVSEINGDIDPNFDLIPQNIMETGDVLNLPNNQFCDIENKPISAWTIRPYSNVFGLPGLNECLYVDNEDGGFCDAIGYDGYTIPMLFNLLLLPNANYHIQIVIVDGVSGGWPGLDSGVFLHNTTLLAAESMFPTFEYNISVDTVFFNSMNAINPNLTYAWDFDNDGNIDSEEINPMHIFENPGQNTVLVNITNTCTGEVELQTYDIFLNSFDISNLTYTSDPTISIFPNPAYEQINISLPSTNSESYITIYDLAGRVVYDAHIRSNYFHVIDVSNILSGVYYVNIATPSNDLGFIKKLIIL